MNFINWLNFALNTTSEQRTRSDIEGSVSYNSNDPNKKDCHHNFNSKINTMDLKPEKQQALLELRSRVKSWVSDYYSSDEQLVKWLIAQNFNVNKAESMLKKCMEWRREWNVDELRLWEPPEVLQKHYTVGHVGYDNDQCPVWIIPYGKVDIKGLLQSASIRDYIKCTIKHLEESRYLTEQRKKTHPSTMLRQICIFDMEDFSVRHVTWKPGMDSLLMLVQIYEANYPEFLKVAFVINAPKIFAVAFGMMKPFLHEGTMKKIRIFGKTGWKEELAKEIPADQYPKHWGGQMEDPNGDPLCQSRICMGGEVPMSFYIENLANSNVLMNVLNVGKANRETLSFEVKEPMSELRWQFNTDNYDIGFGITYIPSETKGGDQDATSIVPMIRVNSQLVPEEGLIVCSKPGTYTLTFDNEFSYWRSKKIMYNIAVNEPRDMKPPTEL